MTWTLNWKLKVFWLISVVLAGLANGSATRATMPLRYGDPASWVVEPAAWLSRILAGWALPGAFALILAGVATRYVVFARLSTRTRFWAEVAATCVFVTVLFGIGLIGVRAWLGTGEAVVLLTAGALLSTGFVVLA